jgi:hypothetical protein
MFERPVRAATINDYHVSRVVNAKRRHPFEKITYAGALVDYRDHHAPRTARLGVELDLERGNLPAGPDFLGYIVFHWICNP